MNNYKVYYDKGANFPWIVYVPVKEDNNKGIGIDALVYYDTVFFGEHFEVKTGTSLKCLGRRVYDPPMALVKAIDKQNNS